MKKHLFLAVGMTTLALGVSAQEYKEGYIDWGYGGSEFGEAVEDELIQIESLTHGKTEKAV